MNAHSRPNVIRVFYDVCFEGNSSASPQPAQPFVIACVFLSSSSSLVSCLLLLCSWCMCMCVWRCNALLLAQYYNKYQPLEVCKWALMLSYELGVQSKLFYSNRICASTNDNLAKLYLNKMD